MPDRNPQNWTIAAWVALNGPWILAGALAFVMSLLKNYWQHNGLKGRDLAEGSMCLIFVSVSRPFWVGTLEMPDAMSLLIGCMVGAGGARVIISSAEKLAEAFGGRRG